MTASPLPLAEVTRRAIEVLARELGPADTLRFMAQFTNGLGDYTVEREDLFAGRTLDEIVTEIHRGRAGPEASPSE